VVVVVDCVLGSAQCVFPTLRCCVLCDCVLQVPAGLCNSTLNTPSTCEVGDLSGKHGNFGGSATQVQTYTDSNLPLTGQYSVVGRSVVLHAAANGTRLACASISTNGGVPAGKMASATFGSGGVQGTMSFFQTNPSAATDFSVQLTLGSSAPYQSHVHVLPLAAGASCASVAGHYNPTR
jgi:hypothetical protein